MKPYFLISICLALLCSCDSSYSVHILNATKGPIDIVVRYNKPYLDSLYKGRNYKSILSTITYNPLDYIKKYDSINLIITYEVPPQKLLQLETALSGYNISMPDLTELSDIQVKTNSGSHIYPRAQFNSLFSKVSRNEFEWRIK